LAYTKLISDGTSLAKQMAKNPGNWDANALSFANMVLEKIWTAAPWKFNGVLTDIPAGLIALADGVQDYSPPSQIYRLVAGSIVRTDVSPNEVIDLNVQDSLVVDLKPRSYQAIQAVSLEPAAGQLRLDGAVQVPSGTTLELRGTFQMNYDAAVTTATQLFTPDEYFPVFLAGLEYWAYKISDDSKAGTVTFANGRAAYSGQLGSFMALLEEMKIAEDYGGDEQIFPSDAMGGRFYSGGLFGIYGGY